MNKDQSILELVLNLTEAINSGDRYLRLLKTITNSLPCDAASLMVKEDHSLKIVASLGLDEIVETKAFKIKDHPRLEIIFKSSGPVVFPHNSNLPDPFDGLIAHDHEADLKVHACLGCPLEVEGKVIGVLTVDAIKPHKFDNVDKEWLKTISALAGATLQTSLLINKLESLAEMEKRFAQSFVAETNKQQEVELVGMSPIINQIKKHIEIVAQSNLSILVTGETGVGKEIVVRLIHKNSSRANQPLVYVNCAALPENIVESELFGHVKGAFTGAVSDRMGKFQLANNGTLFLDEIGELPLHVQAKLLRALQEGEVQKVGADKISKVNVRFIAATNRNLEDEVQKGCFRSDLFHRLSVYPINVPALRERKEDISLLIRFFSNEFQRRLGTNTVRVTQEAQEKLVNYSWPGNVRELKNLLSRAILTAKNRSSSGQVLNLKESDFAALPQDKTLHEDKTLKTVKETNTLKEATQSFQKHFILKKLSDHNFNWSQTAKNIGMHRSNLHNLGIKLGIKK